MKIEYISWHQVWIFLLNVSAHFSWNVVLSQRLGLSRDKASVRIDED